MDAFKVVLSQQSGGGEQWCASDKPAASFSGALHGVPRVQYIAYPGSRRHPACTLGSCRIPENPRQPYLDDERQMFTCAGSFNPLLSSNSRFARVECFAFASSVLYILDDVVWPENLRKLTIGKEFNGQSNVSHGQLTVGMWFNQPIDGVTWPPVL